MRKVLGILGILALSMLLFSACGDSATSTAADGDPVLESDGDKPENDQDSEGLADGDPAPTDGDAPEGEAVCDTMACAIAGICYADGTLNPATPCQKCEITANPSVWTNLVFGAACPGGTCDGAGHCSAAGDGDVDADTGNACGVTACAIAGICYAAGTPNPATPCQTCDPSAAKAVWTNRSFGTSCNDGDPCTKDETCDGAGACKGTPDPVCQSDGDSENERENESAESDTEGVALIPTTFRVGYAEIDSTPPTGTVMGAYGVPGGGRKTTGVHDRLRSQVMLFVNDAGQSFILIATDFSGYFFEYGDWNDPSTPDGEAPGLREIRQNIAAALKGVVPIAPESIVLTSSHSHASPDMAGFFQASNKGPDKALARFYRDQFVQAAKDAATGLVDADLFFGKTEIGGLSTDSKGCYGGKIDNSISLIQAKKKDGTVIFTAANYALHPTTQGNDNSLVSADFVWGYREEMEKSVAGKAVFLQGAPAAIYVKPSTVQGTGWDLTYNVGMAVATTVKSALPTLSKATEFDILHRTGTTSCVAEGGLLLAMLNSFKVPKRTLTPIYAGGSKATQPVAYRIAFVEVSWHKLGPAEFQTFPGEATPALGLGAKAHMISPNKFVLGLANDSLGYIIDESSRQNDPSIHAGGSDDVGQLAGYELPMGMGAPGGPCVWEAIRQLGWFDGAFKPAK